VTAPEGHAGLAEGVVLLDKYRVVRELGAGGMSRVLCAQHVALGTKVAIKVLHPHLASLPDAPQRFVREAQAATRIKSEHVAQVIDVGTLPDGTPYMLMEYLEGKDLGRYVKEGKRFDVADAIDYVVQACDALARAHKAGVVHRDVKPSNLFLTTRPDGTPLVKVLDFGISKVVEEAAKENLELTKTTAIMGSALYMSLEQMRSSRTVDHRTDIWALGVTLYELLSGTHPFTAESFSELCVKVSLDPPDPLRRHRPDVPEELAQAIEIAYARNMQERYQTAGRLAEALVPWANEETLARIEAIQRFERASYPDGSVPERQPTPLHLKATDVERPPRIDWLLYTAIAGAGLAGAALLWLAMDPVPSKGTTGDPQVDAAAPPASVADASDAVIPVLSALPPADAGAPEIPDASAAASTDAGLPDAGKTRPLRPCKPGQVVLYPNGLRKPCGM
jgi:serine/threonine-protein kinase